MVITMNKEQRDDNGDDDVDVDDAAGCGGVRNKICHSRRLDILPMYIIVKKKHYNFQPWKDSIKLSLNK